MNRKLSDVQAGFQRGRGIKDQIANICWIMEKARESQKNIYFFFTDWLLKPLAVWMKINCAKFLEMGVPDHFTYLLRNPYLGQEATFRTRHGTTDWFKIGKWVQEGCIWSSCLFNLHAEYIMQYARLDESQAGIRIAGTNINFRYAHDTTLIAENG